MDGDATAPVLADVFGLDGFEVLAAADAPGELEIMVERRVRWAARAAGLSRPRRTAARRGWPTSADHGPAGPAVLGVKRIWRCPYRQCQTNTWTETHEAIAARAMLTESAPAGTVDGVAHGATVAGRARRLGVGWQTVNRQVLDLTPGRPARQLDLVEGRSGAVLRGWLQANDSALPRSRCTDQALPATTKKDTMMGGSMMGWFWVWPVLVLIGLVLLGYLVYRLTAGHGATAPTEPRSAREIRRLRSSPTNTVAAPADGRTNQGVAVDEH